MRVWGRTNVSQCSPHGEEFMWPFTGRAFKCSDVTKKWGSAHVSRYGRSENSSGRFPSASDQRYVKLPHLSPVPVSDGKASWNYQLPGISVRMLSDLVLDMRKFPILKWKKYTTHIHRKNIEHTANSWRDLVSKSSSPLENMLNINKICFYS